LSWRILKLLKEDIETSQWLPMPNGTSLLCKIDRVQRDKNEINVHDTKTSAWPLTDYWFRQFENHLPTTLYDYAVKEVCGHCDRVIIDAIKVPYPKPGSTTQPFARQSFWRTELQLQDAVNSYCKITDYVMNCINNVREELWPEVFYCNHGQCDKYSGCPYFSICKYGLDHPSIHTDFTVKTPER
jgi:hypothetical protein